MLFAQTGYLSSQPQGELFLIYAKRKMGKGKKGTKKGTLGQAS